MDSFWTSPVSPWRWTGISAVSPTWMRLTKGRDTRRGIPDRWRLTAAESRRLTMHELRATTPFFAG